MGPDEFVLVMVKMVKLSSGEIQFTVKQINMSQFTPEGVKDSHGSEEWLQPPTGRGDATSPQSLNVGEHSEIQAERSAETRSPGPSSAEQQQSYTEIRNPVYSFGQARMPRPGESSPTVAYLSGRGDAHSPTAAPHRFPPPAFPPRREQKVVAESQPDRRTPSGRGGTEVPSVVPGRDQSSQAQNLTSPAQGWWEGQGADDFDLTAPDLDEMSKSALASYLLRAGADFDQSNKIFCDGWTGRQWTTVLDPKLDAAATKAVWDLIGLSGAVLRMRLMADVKEAHGRRDAKASAGIKRGVREPCPEKPEGLDNDSRRVRVDHAPKIPTGLHQPMDGNGDNYG